MNPAIIQLIILGIAIVLFAIDKMPLALTALLATVAIYFTGVGTAAEAFGGFANNSVLMMIGLYIIGNAFVETGLIAKFGEIMQNFFTRKGGELTNKKFNLGAGVLTAGLSAFVNPMIIVAIFHNIVDGIAVKSNGKFQRKYSYLPISLAAGAGVANTSISSSTAILASGMLAASSFGRGFTLFEPAIIGIPAVIVWFLFFSTIGHTLMVKTCNFEDIPVVKEPTAAENGDNASSKKMYLALATFLVCLGFIIFSDFQVGPIALAGACVLMVTKCIEPMKAFRTLPWHSIVLVASLLGIAKGMEVSGAGKLAADFLIRIAGPVLGSTLGLYLMCFTIPHIVGMFMNNSAVAALSLPIFLIVAEQLGRPLLPVALAVGIGALLKTSTPTATHIAMSVGAGYRFWDYFKIGGLLNIVSIIVCSVVLTVFYG